MKDILVTGGAGYIGTHTCVELLNDGYNIIVVDNLSNSSLDNLRQVEKITGKTITFIEGDLCDKKVVEDTFKNHKIDAVIHFAALKAVGESVEKPILYYQNNLVSTLNILEAMQTYGCKSFIFSSSATVYGDPETLPIKEDARLSTQNPYGTTKLMIEEILKDFYQSNPDLHIIALRYFNPIGAHVSGLIGENPNGIPNNLLPYISRVASGKLKELSVFGNDYDTKDGTGARDYIHVVDLAKGHVKALEHIKNFGYEVFNLGTGTSYTVLEIIEAFEKASGKKVPYKITARRKGDIAACYADPSKALKGLGWQAQYDLNSMCEDAWRFQMNLKK